MLESGKTSSMATPSTAASARYLAAFRWMLLARALEDRIAGLYRAGGKIVGGVYLGRGQEAFSAALGTALSKDRGDVFGGLIRDMAGRLAFGEPLLDPVRTYLGSAKGPMRGRDGNIHRGRPSEGMPAMISHLGSLVSVVCGMLMARRFRQAPPCVGATCVGDGATSTGSFHEALNLAAVEGLPLVVGVANNQYAYSTPTERQYACEDLVDRAAGYGVAGHSVDGTDLGACIEVFDRAVKAALETQKPQMVVGKMLRLSGHGEHDDAWYVDRSLQQEASGRDPLDVSRSHVVDSALATEAEVTQWQEETSQEVSEAIAQVQNEQAPSAIEETWDALATRRLVEGRAL